MQVAVDQLILTHQFVPQLFRTLQVPIETRM